MSAVAAVVSLMLALGYQGLPYRDPAQLVAAGARALAQLVPAAGIGQRMVGLVASSAMEPREGPGSNAPRQGEDE